MVLGLTLSTYYYFDRLNPWLELRKDGRQFVLGDYSSEKSP